MDAVLDKRLVDMNCDDFAKNEPSVNLFAFAII